MTSENINKFIDHYVTDPAFREALKKGADAWEQVLLDNGHQLSEGEKQQLINLQKDIQEFHIVCPGC